MEVVGMETNNNSNNEKLIKTKQWGTGKNKENAGPLKIDQNLVYTLAFLA